MTPKPVGIFDGVPWWNWSYEYDWNGKTYSFEICAPSKEDADARLKRLPLARFQGQCDGTPIPINPATKAWVPLLVWWRNLRQGDTRK